MTATPDHTSRLIHEELRRKASALRVKARELSSGQRWSTAAAKPPAPTERAVRAALRARGRQPRRS